MKILKLIILCMLLSGCQTPNAPKLVRTNLNDGVINLQETIEIAKNITSKQYPSSDTVLIDDYEKIIYNSDGTSERWDEVYEKLLTEKGKRENSIITLHYTLPYSIVKLTKLEVIKPDGKIIPVDIKKQSKTIVNPSQMNSNIYNPNSKIIKINIPNLEINDTIHSISYRNTTKTRVKNTWCDITTLEYTSPIKHYTIDITAPKLLPLKHLLIKNPVKDAMKYTKKEYKKSINHKWEINNVPRIFKEPSMPEYWTVTQRLLVSTTPTWETLSKWYWNLSEPRLAKTTEKMKEKVYELIKGIDNRDEKIKAIFQFVSQKIRYMGITTEKVAPGYEPHDVNITFENRYGVCRDKAALLVAMLKIAGFKAYPVLINNGPKKDIEVPNNYFNHAISCVENSDGSYTLMDSTDENTKDIFPAYLCDKSYLVAKPDGETLLTSAIIPPEKNLMVIKTEGVLDKNGDISAKTILSFNGINDGVYRGYFLRNNNIQKRLFFEGKLKKILPGAELTGIKIYPEKLSDMSIPLSITIEYKANNNIINGKDIDVMPIPLFGNSFGMVNFILDSTALKKRKYIFKTDIACGVQEFWSLKLNKNNSKINLPIYQTINNKNILWKQNLRFKNNTISATSEFLIKGVEFSPKEYLDLKKDLEDIEYNNRKMIIITK